MKSFVGEPSWQKVPPVFFRGNPLKRFPAPSSTSPKKMSTKVFASVCGRQAIAPAIGQAPLPCPIHKVVFLKGAFRSVLNLNLLKLL